MMTDLYSSFPMTFERNDPGVLEMVFDGPNLNAVGEEVHRELPNVWRVIAEDPETRVVLVRGAGKAFSAGGSFDMIEKQMNEYETNMRVLRETRDLYYTMLNFPKPIVTAIHGPAVGAGLIVAMLSDITIAARTASIIDGHTRLGVTAGDHAVGIWPLLCGMAKAKYYLLTCDKMSGEEAERCGMVSLCVDDEELLDKSREVAGRLSKGAQDAIQFTKLSLNNWFRQAGPMFEASLGYEFLNFGGPDVREGLASHKERRPPKFV